MSYIGTTKIGKMYLGNTEIAKAYLGNDLVFQKGGSPTPPPSTYIQFADPNVEAVCVATWGDGVGITEAQAAAVPYDTPYNRNQFWNAFSSIISTITSFDELRYFVNVNEIPATKFSGNTVLTTIGLDNVASIGASAFNGCTSLAMEIDVPNLLMSSSGQNNEFRSSGITKIKDIGNSQYLSDYFFANNCPGLTEVHLPATLINVGRLNFTRCSNLTTVVCLATTPPAAGGRNFDTAATLKIYVPYSADHSILNAYKAASGWADNANQIYELNQDGTIPS